MKYPKEEMRLCIYGDSKKLKLVEDDVVDNSEWRIEHHIIFKDLSACKFYSTNYYVGATECQEEIPFEYDPDMVEVQEVEHVEKTVKVWEVKKGNK